MTGEPSPAAGFTRTERIVVICLYCEGLTPAETAEATGLALGEVDRIHNEVVARTRQLLYHRPPR